jgi:uncharacterized membrane protein (DUF106 family)
VNQKVLQLQKEKERFANQLEKLEKLNQAKEQIERLQRELTKWKNKRTIYCGLIHHTIILATTKEPQEKTSSRVT